MADRQNERLIGSAADCRLIVFDNISNAKSIWIKGHNFSLPELLNKKQDSIPQFTPESSIAIFRLAPSDYHRYHHPIGPVRVLSQEHAGSQYYTVK